MAILTTDFKLFIKQKCQKVSASAKDRICCFSLICITGLWELVVDYFH